MHKKFVIKRKEEEKEEERMLREMEAILLSET